MTLHFIRRAGCAWALVMLALSAAHAARGLSHRSVDVSPDSTGRLRPAGVLSDTLIATAQRYWADPSANAILRSDSSGQQIEAIAGGLNLPYGLGFDVEAQSFLWTSSGDETVQKLVAGAHDVTTLQTSFGDPPALEIPHEGGKQAITVVGEEVVRVTEDAMTGDIATEVLMHVDAVDGVHGLALDADARLLYVGNAVGMMAYRLDLANNTATRLTFTDHVPPVADPDEGEPQ